MSLINGGLATLGSDGLAKLNLGLVQTAATAAAKIRGLASAGSIISDANRPAADATNVDGTPRAGAPLTIDEFRALGLAVDNAPANLKLLNEAFNARPNFASVSDPAKIAALNLVDIVNRVMRQADADLRPDQAPAGISLAEWTTLGLSNTGANPEVTAASISAFMAAIKARSPSEVDTLAELKAVALAARAAQIKISGYAERESSGNVAQAGADAVTPTAKDFADMGVRGLDKFGAATPGRADAMPEGLFTVLSTLASAPVNGARTATAELVQGIVDSANKVLALADGRANQPANVPGQEDYRLLGADLDGIGVARNKGNYLTLLNSVIDPLPADKADTPTEWLALATTAAKVLDAAGGAGVLPVRADLLQLGVTGLSEANLPAVQRKLQQVPADKLDSINTLAGLQALVDKAVAGQEKIRTYAGDSNNAAPTAQDYADMGVLLPAVPATVAAGILSAANKALASGPIGPDQAGTPDLVQAIVNSYAKVLALADGAVNAAPVDLPTAQDYSNIGMDRALLGKLGDPSRLLLLNQLVDGAPNSAAIDSPTSLNALATLANKVQDVAAQQTGDVVAPESVLSATDLAALGIKNLSAAETDAVVAALQSKTPVDVDTLVELQAMAVAARSAINKIMGYADRNAGDAPQVADYLAIGVRGVADVGAVANKDAINAALATGAVDGAEVSTVRAVQVLVDSYNSLLRQADGMPSNTPDDKLAGAGDFANIGVDLGRFAGLDSGGAGASENAVKLLSSIVDSRSASDIDTPQKISAFAAMVVKIALTVQGDNSSPPTVADFAALKITGVNDGNLALVLAQLARQPDDGSNTNTWARLADAVFTVTNVPASGASWTYSTDNGLTWSAGSGTSVLLTGDGSKNIQVRQTDAAGNVGPISDSLGFTLDTTAPGKMSLKLANDTGSSATDNITNDGRFTINGMEKTATYQLSLDNVNWYSQDVLAAVEKANAEKGIVADPRKTLYIRQIDAAGNMGPISDPLVFIRDVVPPAKITASLMKDTGASASDRITNDGTVGVSAMEAGASLQYSLDGGTTWLNAVGNNFKVLGAADGGSNTDGQKSVLVRQVDVAGNEGPASAALSFTLDTLPQGKLGLALANDTGVSSNDRITSDGTLNVSGLEAGASWQYSLDDGARWTSGSGASVKLTGDADKSVVVRAIDVAGNAGPKSDTLRMTLDTRADAPTVDMISSAGKTADGASVSVEGSFVLAGNAEKGAQVVVRRSDGQVMGAVQASTTNGAWSLEIKGSVQVNGLKRTNGTDSDANGVYRLLSASDLFTLQKTFGVEVFGGDASRVDLSRPAYSKTIGDQTWYLFATVDSGYLIAQQGNTKEWFFQWGVGDPPSLQPEDVSNWGLATMSFSQIQIEAQQNGGQSSGQTLLPGVEVVNSNGTRTRTWTYWVEQTDLAGNLSPRATFNVLVETAAPPALDLNATVAGTQTAALRQSSNSELRAGTAFLADVAAPLKNSATAINVVFGGTDLRLADDRLLLDALVALDQNLAPVKGKTVGGVTDVSYVYTTATRTLVLTKTLGGTFTGQEVEAIVENIKLQNVAPTPGRRTIDISLVDAGKLVSPIVRATLAVSSDNLLIDLDPQSAGVQLAATRMVTDANALAAGVAFDANVGAPSATAVRAVRVSLGGAGLDPKADKLMLDVPVDLSISLAAVNGRTVGGVSGVSYSYDASARILDIRKTDSGSFSGSQVQSLIQAIKVGGAALGDGVRTAGFALVSTTDETGGTSTATLVVDTRAPLVDLNGALAGVQNSASKSISAARATAGESLFPQETVVLPANDIASIKLAMSGAALDLARDKLVLDQPLGLNTAASISGNHVIGGVAGLSYGYDNTSRTVIISKTAGTAMTSDEVSSIVKAIQFKNAAPQAGDRLASLTLTDLAGNSSTASVKLSVDTTVPASLKATLTAGNQLSYKMLSVPDVLGPINKHTLTTGESVDLSSLMPGSGDAVSLLSSLKGIYGEWGGLAFSGNGNTTNPDDRSVIGFSSSPGFDHSFNLILQNNRVVRGGSYFFTAPDANKLVLNAQGGFAEVNTDVFAFNPEGVPMDNDYEIGNLRLLFQAPTANANTQPTIQVSFDGTRAAAGDVIRLMEGGQVLASRTLSDADLGSSNVTLSLTPASSLSVGQHTLSSKYIDVAGNTVTGNDIVLNVLGGATAPVLSNLKVSGGGQAAQEINDSTTRYAMVSEAAGDSTGSSGLQHQLSFTGTVGTAGSGHNYLVTVSMGGKLLAFNQFAGGDFKLDTPANMLAPGFYKDLSIVATDVTDGLSNGQSTAIGGQTLGWYWAPQNLTKLTAGAGDDRIPLGVAATANGIYNTEVQTGAGKDTLVVGAFGTTDSARLMARVTDFMVGTDKVSVAGQTVTADNLGRFVTASAAPANGTILSIDLDGPGPGSLTYSLLLVGVQYAQSNTHTIFGV
ncbi:hypothetical protein ABIC71_001733 [Herbaspirillum seropedicae]|uniref:Ig-like domain-containing protein n=1 Tax=Herbaspirillum seropedicae TaxID=964 RepID=UPI003393114F